MEIPVLTNFIEGLKLFFASKRMKWLTFIFFLGAFFIYLMERIIVIIPGLSGLITFLGGIFPFFWMLMVFVSLLGQQRFIASEEDYKKSAMYTVVWLVVSTVLFVISLLIVGVLLTIVFLGFFVWIGFQGYFSTRTALGIASSVEVKHRSKFITFLFGLANLFNYVIIFGAFIVTWIILYPFQASVTAVVGAVIGLLIVIMFNLINGLIIAAERNKPIADNLVLLGLFISLYSAYFMFNVLKGVDTGFENLVGIAITIFFLLYTMSGVGSSLSSRAEMDTRLKLSKELAATFTFFIASSYVFVDVMFTALTTQGGLDPAAAAPVSDIIKLWLFPFIALAMVIRYLWKSRKTLKVPETPEDLPVVPVEEVVYDERGEGEEEEPSVIEETEPMMEEPSEDFGEPIDSDTDEYEPDSDLDDTEMEMEEDDSEDSFEDEDDMQDS